jgi:hypothetical protein
VSPLILNGNDPSDEAVQQAAFAVIQSPVLLPLPSPQGLLALLNLDPLVIGGDAQEAPLLNLWVLHFGDENNALQGAAQNIGVFLNNLLATPRELPDRALGA